MNVIGIDPGITGAVSIVTDIYSYVVDIPIESVSKTAIVKNRVNATMLKIILSDMIVPRQDTRILIEAVASRPGQGGATTFSFGDTFGCIRGVCESLYPTIEVGYVLPQAWKKHFGISKDKSESLELARSLYPDAPLERKKDNDRAEALLIAKYGRHIYSESFVESIRSAGL